MSKDIKLHETEEMQERLVVISIERESRNNQGAMDAESCLDELEELIKTAGAVTVGRMVQKREKVHPGHYLGKGKVEEVNMMVTALDATGVVCDDELSPAQLKNLGQMLNTKIMDRTMVILDIFAGRALSGEGKIQVELAQLKYRLSRLSGLGISMSRLGGGIGTRGPGEKKLETDRRYIKERIAELNSNLKDVEIHRQLLRDQRQKKGTPVVSLVGYTNAGKSTIINKLTDAGVLAEDKLFATLDTTTRRVGLPGGSEMYLTDTVGFIQKLPHHLIQAFRATLEELKQADVLLHVVDGANPRCKEQMGVVYKTLKDLGCENKPVLTIFNKMDKEHQLPLPSDEIARASVQISAKTGVGIDSFLLEIENLLKSFRNEMTAMIPFSEGALIHLIHNRCEVVEETHTGEGTLMTIYVDEEISQRLRQYEVQTI